MGVLQLLMNIVLLSFTVGKSRAMSKIPCLLWSATCNHVAGVSLTVEGGASLIGEHCPGTVRLFCEGVQLTTLRWSYNVTNKEIHSFYPDSVTSTQIELNSAFISVALRAVSQNGANPIYGNFSSTLTLDISQIVDQHINEIRCGDPANYQMIPIDIQIRQQSQPKDPQQFNIQTSVDFSAYESLARALYTSL